MTSLEMISEERKRQIEKEGYSAAHDDHHEASELAMAAACYAAPVPIYTVEHCGDGDIHPCWPWEDDESDCMDKHSEIKRLVIAGALISAEIDRLLRKEPK